MINCISNIYICIFIYITDALYIVYIQRKAETNQSMSRYRGMVCA